MRPLVCAKGKFIPKLDCENSVINTSKTFGICYLRCGLTVTLLLLATKGENQSETLYFHCHKNANTING